MHHAYAIEAPPTEGIAAALAHVSAHLGLAAKANPDVIILEYGLFSVEEARRVAPIAAQSPVSGTVKAVIIAATRAYHESQNALLKLFEEPPAGTYLYFVVPSLGMLLPTLRSRVQVISENYGHRKSLISEEAREFITATREKRTVIAKKLATGADEDARRANRDHALAIVNGIEVAAYGALKAGEKKAAPLLAELAILRGHLHDRSAPVRMILEHLALVVPRNLV